jgi:predicted nucleic acid-binding protein
MENDTFVIDASVAVKWFHQEPDTRQAEILEERIAGGDIRAIVPPLLFYEVANALTLKAGSHLEEIIAAHHILVSLPFHVTEVLYTILEDAILIARRHRLSVYDAIYVALAIASHASLVTADKKLAEAVGAPVVLLLSDIS